MICVPTVVSAASAIIMATERLTLAAAPPLTQIVALSSSPRRPPSQFLLLSLIKPRRCFAQLLHELLPAFLLATRKLKLHFQCSMRPHSLPFPPSERRKVARQSETTPKLSTTSLAPRPHCSFEIAPSLCGVGVAPPVLPTAHAVQ